MLYSLYFFYNVFNIDFSPSPEIICDQCYVNKYVHLKKIKSVLFH